MYHIAKIITVVVLLALSYCGMTASASPYTEQEDGPALVNPVVKIVWKNGEDWSHCSAFYVGDNNLVTAAHCITKVTGFFFGIEGVDGNKLKQTAKVIAFDDRLDFALLKIVGDKPAPISVIGVDCSDPKIGDEIQIEGFPTILGYTVTFGRVTSLPKGKPDSDKLLDWPSTSIFTVDAMLDKGNSGGPVIDSKTGKVVGTAVAYFHPNTVSYSLIVPASAYCKYL